MYQNKVTLIGFLGSDAEVRSNDNRSFTTLSLATKSSYKRDGKYISHTEWLVASSSESFQSSPAP
jgi:single-strand DNA-binding protein